MAEANVNGAGLVLLKQDKFRALLQAITEVTAEAIKFWQQTICPYLAGQFNINAKIAENVKIFRILVELMYAPTSDYANHAREYFISMQSSKFEKLTKYMAAIIDDMHVLLSDDPDRIMQNNFNICKMFLELTKVRSNALLDAAIPKSNEILNSARPSSRNRLSA